MAELQQLDTAALRRFYDTVGPIVDAIPGVLDLAAQQADLRRGIHMLSADLKDAQDKMAGVQQQYAEAELAHRDELDALAKQKAAMIADADATRATLQTELAALKDEHENGVLVYGRRTQELRDARAAAEAQHAKALQQLQEDADAKKVLLQNEVTTLEARRDEAAAALASLRARLG